MKSHACFYKCIAGAMLQNKGILTLSLSLPTDGQIPPGRDTRKITFSSFIINGEKTNYHESLVAFNIQQYYFLTTKSPVLNFVLALMPK